MADDFEIGAHTVHHLELPKLSDSVAYGEIYESKQRLEEITGRRCDMFCAPKGRFRNTHLKMIQQMGFLGVRTVEFFSLDWPMSINGLALVPTTIQAHSHELTAYARNCLRRCRPARLYDLFKSNGQTGWESIATRLLERACERGGVFHLWGHSWEIDANRLWGALEYLLELMGQVAKRVTCTSNVDICRYAN